MSITYRPLDSTPISIEDFKVCGWEAGKNQSSSYFEWWYFFCTQGAEANQAGKLAKARVLWLLADACSLRLLPSNANEPLQASDTGNISQAKGITAFAEYVDLISQAYQLVDEPLLQARLADIAWLARSPKRKIDDALAAIDAYRGLPLTEDCWFIQDGERVWRRAIALASGLGKIAETRLIEMVNELKKAVEAGLRPESQDNAAISMAKVLLEKCHLTDIDYEDLAELLFKKGRCVSIAGRNFHARIYILAAKQFFTATKNEERAADMAVAAAQTHVGEATVRTSGAHASYSVATEFYTEAIQELQTIPKGLRESRNIKAELNRLYGLLREAGARSLDEFATFQSDPIDIKEEVEASLEQMSDKEFMDALLNLAGICRYASKAEEEDAAKISMTQESFSRLFAISHIAGDGRLARRTPAVDDPHDDSEDARAAVLGRMVQHHVNRVDFLVKAAIAPARHQFLLEHFVDEQDLFDICLQSRVVPRSRAWLVAKGLKAGFDGDFASALHLLTPQLEHMVRTHLNRRGVKTTRLESDGVLVEAGLSTLVVSSEMQDVFGPDLTFEILALFCDQRGPNLRNYVAHGLLEPGGATSSPSIYAWWLIFKLVFSNYWPTQIVDPQALIQPKDSA